MQPRSLDACHCWVTAGAGDGDGQAICCDGAGDLQAMCDVVFLLIGSQHQDPGVEHPLSYTGISLGTTAGLMATATGAVHSGTDTLFHNTLFSSFCSIISISLFNFYNYLIYIFKINIYMIWLIYLLRLIGFQI